MKTPKEKDPAPVIKKDSTSGFQCLNCNKFNAFDAYVFAHMDVKLVHNCACGARHEVFRGKVSFIKKA